MNYTFQYLNKKSLRRLIFSPNRLISTDFGRVTPVVKTGADDDFLPDFEEKEMEHLNRLESTIQVHKKPDNMLRHDEEVAGILYKYDLPVQNMPISFKS